MQNPHDVTTAAFDGCVREIAIEIGVTDKRLYEILGRDNPYVKCWRIFNALGRISPDRLALIRADFEARCDRIIGREQTPPTAASIHKETSDAVQSVINGDAPAKRRKEIVEAIAELQKELSRIDDRNDIERRVRAQFSVGGTNV
jgi:hypothetical protein